MDFCSKTGHFLSCYSNQVSASRIAPFFIQVATVFLDRDGVVNRKMPEGHYVSRWDDFHLLAGVSQAIGRMNRAGLRVVMVTNQRGVSKGLYTLADVNTLHAQFQRQLEA